LVLATTAINESRSDATSDGVREGYTKEVVMAIMPTAVAMAIMELMG
jgi:hypothetical protein